LAHLFLIRHGASFFNERKIITGSLDVPLTKKGIMQSQKLEQQINCSLDIVFTSSLIRSIETAFEFLRLHCQKYNKIPMIIPVEQETINLNNNILPVYKTNLIDERNYGCIQGVLQSQIDASFSPSEISSWKTTMYAAPPEGECLEDVKKRTDLFYEKYLKKYLCDSQNIVIICHQNTIKTLRMTLDPNKYTDIHLKNCEILEYII